MHLNRQPIGSYDSTLLFAAMDTTSNAMSRIVHMLSENQNAQDRLREELVNAQQEVGGDLDYDTLHELPYLDAVCRETLRLCGVIHLVAQQSFSSDCYCS